jgi:hypothetical protein
VMRGGTYFRNAQLWGCCYPTYSIGTILFHFVLWYLEDTCEASWEKWAKKKARLLEKWNAHWSRWKIICNKMPAKYTTKFRPVLYISQSLETLCYELVLYNKYKTNHLTKNVQLVLLCNTCNIQHVENWNCKHVSSLHVSFGIWTCINKEGLQQVYGSCSWECEFLNLVLVTIPQNVVDHTVRVPCYWTKGWPQWTSTNQRTMKDEW